jgi:hypothetical protein
MAMHDLRPPPLAPRGNSLSLYVTDLPFGRFINLTYYGPCLLVGHATALTRALFLSEPRHRLIKGILY